jgi:hypothetical protein
LAFYAFFREVCGLMSETEKLEGLEIIGKTAGWFLPFTNICWISERHSKVHQVKRGGRTLLHNERGPAVLFPDGWAIWAINGVRVPQKVVEKPNDLTVAEIQSEANAEIRRVMMERFGWSRYLVESGAKEIHRDDWGILYRQEIKDDEPLVMVKVVNGTPEPDGSIKDYFLRVPPNVNKARDAVAWTFGQEAAEYEPLVET